MKRGRPFLVLALVALALPAHAAAPELRTTGLHVSGAAKLAVSVGIPDVIQPAAAQRLTSGFATRVLIRVELYREGVRDPVARAFRLSDIVYDLWGETFRVLRRSDSGAAPDEREAAT